MFFVKTVCEVRLYVAKYRSTLFTVAVQNVNVYCVLRPIITTLRLQNVDFKNDADTSHRHCRQVQTTKPQQYFKKFDHYKHCTKCLKSVLFERKRTVDERKIDVLSTMLCNVYPTLPLLQIIVLQEHPFNYLIGDWVGQIVTE